MKTATLKRSSDDSIETLGTLTCDEFSCKVIERPWLNNEHNISCIPVGEYSCRWAYMGILKEYHYQVLDVPGRSGIFIHEGNFYTNSEGCILLGQSLENINDDAEIDITNTRATVREFETLMQKQDFILKIVGEEETNNDENVTLETVPYPMCTENDQA